MVVVAAVLMAVVVAAAALMSDGSGSGGFSNVSTGHDGEIPPGNRYFYNPDNVTAMDFNELPFPDWVLNPLEHQHSILRPSDSQHHTTSGETELNQEEHEEESLLSDDALSANSATADAEDLLESPTEQPVLKPRFSSVVTVPGKGKVIHKSTLVSKLNENPHLSKDRLTRVKQKQEYRGAVSVRQGDSESEICLFEDYAIQRSHKVVLGQVVRMLHQGKNLQHPVAFNSSTAHQVDVWLMLYQPHPNGNPCHYVRQDDLLKIRGTDNMTHVTINVSDEANAYIIPESEVARLRELFPCKQKSTSLATPASQPKRSQHQADDGRHVLIDEVATDTSSDPNIRKSSRKRKRIFHEYQ